MLKGKRVGIMLTFLFSRMLFITGSVCLFVFLLSLYAGAEEVFPYAEKKTALMLAFLLLFASLFLFTASAVYSLYFRARLYCTGFLNEGTPERFYGIKQTVRYFRCRLQVIGLKLLWAVLFFSPFFVSIAFLLLLLYVEREMIRSIFFTLILLTSILFIIGAVFYFTVTGRYFLCTYLLFVNPLEDSSGAVESSVMALDKRLIRLAFLRLRLLHYGILSRLPFFICYYRAFFEYMNLIISEKIYSGQLIAGGEKRIKSKNTKISLRRRYISPF